MKIEKKEIKTAEQYMDFARKYITLLDKQLSVWEDRVKKENDLNELARTMPALISLVNTAGYLRGQDGIFLDIRPRTENQDELYSYENHFEDRIDKLIDILMKSEVKEYYIKRLESYLVKSRTQQTPTEW